MNDFAEPFFPPEPVPANSAGFHLPVSAIHVPERIRAVDEAWAQTLAASFEDKGMDTPITVRPAAGDDTPATYSLVIGAHRLAAAKLLGWTTIRALVRHFDDGEARLAEIDENLMRHELTEYDRAVFMRERKEVYERLNPHTRHGAAPKPRAKEESGRGLPLSSPRFTKEVAEKTGLSERSVRVYIQIAKAIDREAASYIVGTKHADNLQTLLALSREPNPAKQRSLAQAMRDGAKTVHGARIVVGDETPAVDNPQERHFATLLQTWMLADAITRKRFLDAIDAAFLTVEAAQKALPKPRRGGRP